MDNVAKFKYMRLKEGQRVTGCYELIPQTLLQRKRTTEDLVDYVITETSKVIRFGTIYSLGSHKDDDVH